MCFINHNILPRELLERGLFSQAHFIRCNEHVKGLGENALVNERVAFLFRALQRYDTEARHPFVEFSYPVVEC